MLSQAAAYYYAAPAVAPADGAAPPAAPPLMITFQGHPEFSTPSGRRVLERTANSEQKTIDVPPLALRQASMHARGESLGMREAGGTHRGSHVVHARPMHRELKATESIDVMDAVGSNIVVNTRGTEVMRILDNSRKNAKNSQSGDLYYIKTQSDSNNESNIKI